MSSSDPWKARPASSKARKHWQAAVGSEPEVMEQARERLTRWPEYRGENPRRLGPLSGQLKHRRIEGQKLRQWQLEITSGGRIWFCPDRDVRIVWVTMVSLSHPKKTE